MRVLKESFISIVEYEILQLSTNGHSFFHSEIRNFTVVFKRPLVF